MVSTDIIQLEMTMGKVIIIYVFLLSGRWDTYPYDEDPMMGPVTNLGECTVEMQLLEERRPDIKTWVCYESGDPSKLISPPYDWPSMVWSTTPKCGVDCTIAKMKEARNGRRERTE